MENKKLAQKTTQTTSIDLAYSRSRDLQDLEEGILENQDILDGDCRLLARNCKHLIENSDAKLQLIEKIQALETNLEDRNFEERNLHLEKLKEMIEQNRSSAKDVVFLQDMVQKTVRRRTKYYESWKSSIIESSLIQFADIHIEHNEKAQSKDREINWLKLRIEVLEADLKSKNDKNRKNINCTCF